MAITANENQFENAQKSSHLSTNNDQLLQTGKNESNIISLINLFHKNIKYGPEYICCFYQLKLHFLCSRSSTFSLQQHIQYPCCSQTYQLLTNIKDRDEPRNRQGAVYKINCSDCHASYIGETGRNLITRLTEHKRETRKGNVNSHIAEHHQLTNHTNDWDSAQCLTYSTNYFQQLTLESWFTNLEQTPLNRCQPLLAPYKRLIHDINITNEPNRTT